MYSQEYIDYMVHFHGDRDYFECHEILEEYWKKIDKNNKESILVAFILLAVSNYHHRRKNFPGAYKTLKKALDLFSIQQQKLEKYGFEPEEFIAFVNEKLVQIHLQKRYKSVNLPIKDWRLIEICKEACEQKGLTWCNQSETIGEETIHRHIIRDRSQVILERENALKMRQSKGRE